MHRTHVFAVAIAIIALICSASPAQGQSEQSRAVTKGGIFVDGWMGKIDAGEAGSGQVLENARLAMEDEMLHVTTGPSVAYWHPDNTASGDYTVKATFTEPQYMNLNNHPHPYGIFIGGSDMGTDQQRYLYCAAYGTGSFIVRGFGPEAFQMNGRRPEANEAVNKAAGQGEPVTQEIAVSVMDGKVQCAINGTVVASYDKAAVMGDGKIKSTDGIYGIRLGHNIEVKVAGLMKQ